MYNKKNNVESWGSFYILVITLSLVLPSTGIKFQVGFKLISFKLEDKSFVRDTSVTKNIWSQRSVLFYFITYLFIVFLSLLIEFKQCYANNKLDFK